MMKRFVSPDIGSSGKFTSMVNAFPNIWTGSVLDVGCRRKELRNALPPETESYIGIDLFPPADVVGNLGAGLPFETASSDTVVALDVLEHTDDIYASFAELCRVARTHVLIALPNIYEIRSRKKFLFGYAISAKYGLPVKPPADRHRWLLSFNEAHSFTHAMGQNYGFGVVDEGCLIGSRRNLIGIKQLVSAFPNLLSSWYIALLRRADDR